LGGRNLEDGIRREKSEQRERESLGDVAGFSVVFPHQKMEQAEERETFLDV
jgi:hypothetical protein